MGWVYGRRSNDFDDTLNFSYVQVNSLANSSHDLVLYSSGCFPINTPFCFTEFTETCVQNIMGHPTVCTFRIDSFLNASGREVDSEGSGRF